MTWADPPVPSQIPHQMSEGSRWSSLSPSRDHHKTIEDTAHFPVLKAYYVQDPFSPEGVIPVEKEQKEHSVDYYLGTLSAFVLTF